MPKSSLMPDEGSYSVFLNDLKTRIRSAQISAAISVNQEMTLLYWHIGREILLRQEQQGWGSKVINRLSQDLKREFPDMKGFSRSNLKYMRAFAESWPDFQIGQQVLANLPWTQNVALLEKLKDPTQRLWYAQQSLENGWGRSVLIAQIETGLYQREGGAITNFEHTLPPAQSELAHEVLKDPYKLDFLTLSKDAEAQDLKRALVKHMRDFLLELGVGFSFVGHDYRVTVDNQEFYIDMLFYHVKLRCYIVIQLELGDFQPEHSGKMNFYLSAIDDQERCEYDQPSIGIILCKAKGKTIVDYSLRHLKNPIAVSTHKLPSAERLQIELDNAVQMIESYDE